MIPRIVLASSSPRRRELLELLGLTFEVRPADIDETERAGEDPRLYVERLAGEKAMELDVSSDELVIAADTTVDVDGEILAKPEDADDARRMLRMLSGRTHQVHTGVGVRLGDRLVVGSTTSVVEVVALTESMIDWYIATGEPFGKAGAYAIQGAGGVFVSAVSGSVSGIVGLPTALLVDLAQQLDVQLLVARTLD
jgi:septum formation protein